MDEGMDKKGGGKRWQRFLPLLLELGFEVAEFGLK